MGTMSLTIALTLPLLFPTPLPAPSGTTAAATTMVAKPEARRFKTKKIGRSAQVERDEDGDELTLDPEPAAADGATQTADPWAASESERKSAEAESSSDKPLSAKEGMAAAAASGAEDGELSEADRELLVYQAYRGERKMIRGRVGRITGGVFLLGGVGLTVAGGVTRNKMMLGFGIPTLVLGAVGAVVSKRVMARGYREFQDAASRLAVWGDRNGGGVAWSGRF